MANSDQRTPVVRLSRTPVSSVLPALVLAKSRPEATPEVQGAPLYAPDILRGKINFFGRFIALLIIPILVGQPIFRVYADEVVADASPHSSVFSAEEENAPAGEPASAPEVSGVTPVGEENTDANPPTPTPPPEGGGGNADTTSTTSADVLPAGGGVSGDVLGDATSTDTASDSATTTEDVIVDVATTTDDIAQSKTDEKADAELGDDEVPLSAEEIARRAEEKSTLDAQAEAERISREEVKASELRRAVESEFMKGCITLDGTGYYCLKGEAHDFSGSVTPTSVMTSATAQEADGNKEIFVQKGGEKIRVTNNIFDDAFPSTDLSGMTVVWQGMQNGRWQIFMATIASSSPHVVQLTNSLESNFNPKTDGGAVTWQGWIDGNWEIILAPPRVGAPLPVTELTPLHTLLGISGEWDVKRLTTNTEHDMFPSIAGDIVTWQAFSGDNWVVAAYNMRTGVVTHLSDGTKKAEKPRFALLWEERDTNGQARMMGLDVGTGQTFDATAEAKRVPEGGVPTFPSTPVSAPDQAALPISAGSTGTSTAQKGDGDPAAGDGGDGGADNPLLP